MTVTINPTAAMQFPADRNGAPLPHCIVVGDTVTALCTMMPMNSCKIEGNMNIGPIDSKHLSISGSITVCISHLRL
ncbi:hypothetical protein KIN20_007439 [Parelaphostrongylus tenuis]|uniref:Uncharacterized protein n=1 Tax=Parelaphostrongylus tenuis TaxID=148309 RepID=A0AAD5MPQ0_PARTN|nr:hypothetical protein KIN20_007439 [Parelaphostrongylus tenuis]